MNKDEWMEHSPGRRAHEAHGTNGRYIYYLNQATEGSIAQVLVIVMALAPKGA